MINDLLVNNLSVAYAQSSEIIKPLFIYIGNIDTVNAYTLSMIELCVGYFTSIQNV